MARKEWSVPGPNLMCLSRIDGFHALKTGDIVWTLIAGIDVLSSPPTLFPNGFCFNTLPRRIPSLREASLCWSVWLPTPPPATTGDKQRQRTYNVVATIFSLLCQHRFALESLRRRVIHGKDYDQTFEITEAGKFSSNLLTVTLVCISGSMWLPRIRRLRLVIKRLR